VAVPPVAVTDDELKPASAVYAKDSSTLLPTSTFELAGDDSVGIAYSSSLQPLNIAREATNAISKILFIVFIKCLDLL
jgi:hypothetical protein